MFQIPIIYKTDFLVLVYLASPPLTSLQEISTTGLQASRRMGSTLQSSPTSASFINDSNYKEEKIIRQTLSDYMSVVHINRYYALEKAV